MKKTQAIDAYDDVAHREIFDLTTPESLVLKLVEKSCILLASCIENLDQSQDEAFQQTSLHALQIILDKYYEGRQSKAIQILSSADL